MTKDDNNINYTNDDEHNEIVGAMSVFLDNGQPKVGIFWYDINENNLFGIEKIDADKVVFVNGKATVGKLHKTYWQKQHHRAVQKKDVTSIFYDEHNYTMIPRGRIFLDEKDGKFYVYVGHWLADGIDGHQIDINNFREVLADEFNLPDDFEFVIDYHWDIGHGWSEELL